MLEEKEYLWKEFSETIRQILDHDNTSSKILELAGRGKYRLPISLDILRDANGKQVNDAKSGLAGMVLQNPLTAIRISEDRLQEHYDYLVGQTGQKFKQNEDIIEPGQRFKVTFEGSLGSHLVSPRGLTSRLANKYVGVQGIVTSISKVKNQLLSSYHYCDETKKNLQREYSNKYALTDKYDVHKVTTIQLYEEDSEGRRMPLMMEYGLCRFGDIQRVSIQEMPENVPTGQLSRGCEIVMIGDLIDLCKPGDRVQINGVYRPISTFSTNISGTFKTVLIATSVTQLANRLAMSITPKELKAINEISKRPDVFELLSRSLAPSIYGHNLIKKAALLQLFGGVEKIVGNGTKLRGDIHLFLVGDPGTAKSQILRRIMKISPLSFSTTGRGSSGVGLTAAVSIDKDTGEKHLEAGAMVLADKGIICVDEFDKMNHLDRVSMHEVMEQQTVTIAKAGIHVSLNARCSVLAAANPLFGEFIDGRSIQQNIGLPDSLLSRFDLIFVVRDKNDPIEDRRIAQKVTNNHRIVGENVFKEIFCRDNEGILEQEISRQDEDLEVYEKFDAFRQSSREEDLVSVRFLQKYISQAKLNVTPELTDETVEYLNRKWTEFRQKDLDFENVKGHRVIPVTIRTLESMIRLATSHAKVRMSNTVDLQDCYIATQLLEHTLFGEGSSGEVPIMDEEGVKTQNRFSQRLSQQTDSQHISTDNNIVNIETITEVKFENVDEIIEQNLSKIYKVIVNLKNKPRDDMFIGIDEVWQGVQKNNIKEIDTIELLLEILIILEKKDKIQLIDEHSVSKCRIITI